MIDLKTLVTYAAVVLGLFLIPGPAVLMTVGRAASGGRRVGVATGLGVATGDLGHAAMATFGLSALLMTSALAFQIVKYAGVAYLIYLGIRAFMEKSGSFDIPSSGAITASRAFRQAGQGSGLDLHCAGCATGAAGAVTRRRDWRLLRQARLPSHLKPISLEHLSQHLLLYLPRPRVWKLGNKHDIVG